MEIIISVICVVGFILIVAAIGVYLYTKANATVVTTLTDGVYRISIPQGFRFNEISPYKTVSTEGCLQFSGFDTLFQWDTPTEDNLVIEGQYLPYNGDLHCRGTIEIAFPSGTLIRRIDEKLDMEG